MDEIELAWLAGLLEGEGCFSQRRQGCKAYPKVTVNMTDSDIILRAKNVMGAKSYSSWRSKHGYKMMYVTSIGGYKAVQLMKKLLPFMGGRRSERIVEILSDYYESHMSLCRSCGGEFWNQDYAVVTCSAECRKTLINTNRSIRALRLP